MKFKILYGNGSEETVTTEHTSDEAFIAAKWGMPHVFEAFLAGGGVLSILDDDPDDSSVIIDNIPLDPLPPIEISADPLAEIPADPPVADPV